MLTDWVAQALDREVVSAVRLGGGDVAESFRVTLGDGQTVFAKTHHRAPPGFFTTEAAGLSWLRDAGTVLIPEVLAVSDDPAFMVLEWIEEGYHSWGRSGEAEFGRALAGLHQAGAPSFGREDRRTTGSRRLPNDPCDTWVEFLATRRLEPLARLARQAQALSESTLDRLDRVIDRLDDLVGPCEPPSRLHGDLWAGNRLIDADGRSWLIDPTACGGHREVDLSMMLLFGGFGADVFRAYDEVCALADGWQARVPLYQLTPLVVHAIKFAGPYVGAVDHALDQIGQ